MEGNNERLVLRPGASGGSSGGAPDETQVAMLVSMGFGPEEATAALWKTGGNGGLQPAIDEILLQRDLLAGNVAPSAAPPAASPVPPPKPAIPAASPSQGGASGVSESPTIKSSFDVTARENHARKEQEDRAKQVRAEQKAKREAQNKIKQQLAEDNIIRRLTQTIRKADTLGTEELERARGEITTYLTSCRPCDELSTMRDQLGNVIAARAGGPVNAAAPAAAAAPAVAAAAAGGGGAERACQVRIRMADGGQVTQEFTSTQTVQAIHDWVAERHGDGDFALIVPGPPMVRQEFGPSPDTLGATLQAAGLVPMGTLTVQPMAKKDMVSKAPDGAEFVSARAPRGGMMRGGRGGMMRMGGRGGMMGGMMGMGGMGGMMGMGMGGGMGDDDEEEEEEEEDEMEYSGDEGMEDSEEAQAAMADAQSASLEAATEAHYAAASGGGTGASAAVKNPVDELGIATEDIPEEFLDPITQQYMVEPVVLPSSGATLDRTTVLRHLRTNPSDPYTQVRLTAQMLVPATELRGKMATWLAGKKAALGRS